MWQQAIGLFQLSHRLNLANTSVPHGQHFSASPSDVVVPIITAVVVSPY